MAAKITRDILESYLNCKLKGHLKITGHQGTKCDYETLLTEMRAEVKSASIEKILARHPGEVIPRNIPLNAATLKQGAPFFLDAALEDDLFSSLRFDGLKKVEGPSKLGDFHYIPMIFHEGRQLRKELKLQLAFFGLLLSRVQGRMPVHGIIWHGKDCKATKVRLNADLRQTERLFQDLKDMRNAESPPKLMLNDHCQICEFRPKCHAQAITDDNLSLLRGLGEKEIVKYGRKGIVTTTQLAYTFRPRRKRNKHRKSSLIRNHSLQAMAIRDKTIYVAGSLELPNTPTQVYLDVEGIPDSDMYYLIGVCLVVDQTETTIQFWADSQSEEANAWKEFLDLIGQLDSFTLFHYGSYDSRFISDMGKKYGIPTSIHDKLELNSVNILTRLYAHVYLPVYSNDLKSVAGLLGFKWSTKDASGIQSIAWRSEWEKDRIQTIKDKLLLYNRDDCQALRLVTDSLRSIATRSTATDIAPGGVIQSEDMKREHPYGFGRNEFFFPELAVINKCAYFDYQRERIYVRTSRAVKESVRREHLRLRTPKINKTVFCETPRQCVYCLSKEPRKNNLVNFCCDAEL